MVREPTKFTYVQDDLTLIRGHLHPAAENKHARCRRRIVFAEFGTGNHRHQRLAQRSVMNEDVGTAAMRIVACDVQVLARQIFQGGARIDHVVLAS